MCCFAEKKAVKIFDLSDANEFEFDAESNSKITLQCGNERVRLRGSPDQMRQWCLGWVSNTKNVVRTGI